MLSDEGFYEVFQRVYDNTCCKWWRKTVTEYYEDSNENQLKNVLWGVEWTQ